MQDVELRVEELATISVGAVGGCMELGAELGFVIGGKMDFLNQFVLSMCEGALVLELASSADFPVPAHLSLFLHLILSDEVVPFLFVSEVLLGFLQSS